jgi:hypothetical protein
MDHVTSRIWQRASSRIPCRRRSLTFT